MCMHACMCGCVHAYIRASMYACMHVHTCMHVCMYQASGNRENQTGKTDHLVFHNLGIHQAVFLHRLAEAPAVLNGGIMLCGLSPTAYEKKADPEASLSMNGYNFAATVAGIAGSDTARCATCCRKALCVKHEGVNYHDKILSLTDVCQARCPHKPCPELACDQWHMPIGESKSVASSGAHTRCQGSTHTSKQGWTSQQSRNWVNEDG